MIVTGKEVVIEKMLRVVPNCIVLYQFGSEAKGQAHAGSDLDLAFLSSTPLSPVQRFDLEQELASLLHRKVDLINLRQASTVMKMQVISSGKCLYSRNDGERDLFETWVYSSYARLNEERREILNDIQKRGSVYAR